MHPITTVVVVVVVAITIVAMIARHHYLIFQNLAFVVLKVIHVHFHPEKC